MAPNRALAPNQIGPTLCVGEILVEIIATTQGNGFHDIQPLQGPYPSGAPAIFIDQCGRMGGAAAMIGAVGNDDFGRLNLDRLARDNVDISAVEIDPDYPTGSAFVRYRQDGSRDFVFNIATSAAARFSWNKNIEAMANRSGHLHVMGSALSIPNAWAVIDNSAKIIKARGGSVSVDPNLRKELTYDDETEEKFAQLIAMADLLLPSGDELERASGVTGEIASVDKLLRSGTKEIVLKRGSRGAACYQSGGIRIDATAFDVQEIDPTGAGDCFGGAYVTARRLGLPVEQALTYGCAAGARNVTFRGPMEGAGTRAELDEFVASNKRLD